MNEIVLYGADWCPDCHRSRQFLDENNIKYQYINIDFDKTAANKVSEINHGSKSIPTIIFPDQTVLVEPSDHQLRDKLISLGLLEAEAQESARQPVDLVVIGAGPAALTAAIYTTREDIETVLFEKSAVGGLAAVTDKIDNYPGFSDGVPGLELSEQMRQQAERFGAKITFGEVQSIKKTNDYIELLTTEGRVSARSVLIATGSDYNKTGVKGEAEYLARGIHYCATCDGAFYRDQRVVVVGGGNSAVQDAIFLTRYTKHIDLLVRSSIKASEILKKDLANYVAKGLITVHLNEVPTEFVANEAQVGLACVKTHNNQTNEDHEFAVDGAFILIGLRPNTKFLSGSGVDLDEIGLVKTDNRLQTNISGIFAAGDVRSGATMQIASASGDGATAALSIREYLNNFQK